MDRAMEGGIDDVGLGVLFGLELYKYEFAGLLILPAATREFQAEMTKILSGVNCEPWKIAADGIPEMK